jgi:hypothetical protein
MSTLSQVLAKIDIDDNFSSADKTAIENSISNMYS